MIVGHAAALRELTGLPFQVTLLLGPSSVGKHTLARQLLRELPAPVYGLEFERLTSEIARDLQSWAATGTSRVRKVAVVGLDGASEQACNQLLKLLEEPPPYVTFVLTASQRPLPTIISRSIVVHLGLLTPVQVRDVLVQGGMEETVAWRLAQLSGGTIAGAHAAAVQGGDIRSRVSRALRAVSGHDVLRLDSALREWGEDETDLLGQWASEAATGHWRLFDASFSPQTTSADARLILGGLSRYPRAAGRVAAASVLSSLALR